MKNKLRQIIYLLISGVLFSVTMAAWSPAGEDARYRREQSNNGDTDEKPLLQPSELFKDFPEIKWGMSFEDVKKTIEKKGFQPVGFKDEKTELAWDGVFNGVAGRGTILFKPDTGVYEMAIIIYAMNKRQEIFRTLQQKIIARHGISKEIKDDRAAVSNVWRLKSGFVLELRLLKDIDNPVVDIHWISK